jgi:ribosomal protein S18 acetylase RimI-like enzyme
VSPTSASLTGRDGYTVRPAAPSDVAEAADVLAVSFTGYPWTAWTVDSRNHTARLQQLFRAVLSHLVLPFGASWVVEQHLEHGSCLVGVAGWLTPASDPPLGVWQELEAVEARLRGDRLVAHQRAEAQLQPLRPDGTHWLLGTVGVHPDHRGRGLAARLLHPGLDAAAQERTEVWLETSSLANVRLYRRCGFEVTAQAEIDQGGPTVWVMRRRP